MGVNMSFTWELVMFLKFEFNVLHIHTLVYGMSHICIIYAILAQAFHA